MVYTMNFEGLASWTRREGTALASISDEDIQKVREASDLVALMAERSPVKQRGRDYWCCCPIHSEKTPSCKIDPVLQTWHCFGCGEGGDVFSYIMKTEDLNFPESVERLAERAHIEIVRQGSSRGPSIGTSQKARLRAVCEETAAFYQLQLTRGNYDGASAARTYMSSRGMNSAVSAKWRLGYAPGNQMLVRHLQSKGFSGQEMTLANVATPGRDGRLRDRFFNRVMFPIADQAGEVIAFGGRVIGKGEPKYLNSQETPLFHKSQVLYGLDKAKNSMTATGIAIVVEGYTDVIAMHEAGVENVVATLGTSLTLQHIRLLSRYASKRIVYLFDGDAAGQRAADRALGFIDMSMTPESGKSRVDLFAVTLPDDLDPADFVSQRGAEALQALIDQATPLVRYGIERRLAAHDLTWPEGRSAALADALSVLAPIKDSALARDYALHIAMATRAREEDVLARLAALEPPRSREVDPGASTDADQARLASAGPIPDPDVPAQPARSLSVQERNRIKAERELLCLCARHPEVALLHADALAQVNWQSRLHKAIADTYLDTLAEDPTVSAADLVSRTIRIVPRAARLIMEADAQASGDPSALAAFLVEELRIGDMEDAIHEYRLQLQNPALLGAEETELLYQSIMYMQKDLEERKKAHRATIKGR